MILFSCSPALAAEKPGLKGRLDVGAKFYHIAISNSVVAGVDAAFDTVDTLSLSLTYHPVEYLSLELGASSLETDIRLGADEIFADYGTFSQNAISLTLKYEGEMEEKDDFRMFVGAGLSRYFNDIERDGGQSAEIKDFFALNRTITEIEDSTGYHANIGFEYLLAGSWILTADILLSGSEATARVRYPDSTIRETTMSLNAFAFGAGLKYRY